MTLIVTTSETSFSIQRDDVSDPVVCERGFSSRARAFQAGTRRAQAMLAVGYTVDYEYPVSSACYTGEPR